MKTMILAAAALMIPALAHAQTTSTTTTRTGVYSAPVAGATPQARENPAPGTTMLEQRERTTVREPRTTVIEQGGSVDADVETRTRVRRVD